MKRRSFLKSTLVASAAGVAVTSGILSSSNAFAAAVMGADLAKAKSVDEIMTMLGAAGATESDKIKIKAPEIAENGAVVPVGITSEIDGTLKLYL